MEKKALGRQITRSMGFLPPTEWISPPYKPSFFMLTPSQQRRSVGAWVKACARTVGGMLGEQRRFVAPLERNPLWVSFSPESLLNMPPDSHFLARDHVQKIQSFFSPFNLQPIYLYAPWKTFFRSYIGHKLLYK